MVLISAAPEGGFLMKVEASVKAWLKDRALLLVFREGHDAELWLKSALEQVDVLNKAERPICKISLEAAWEEVLEVAPIAIGECVERELPLEFVFPGGKVVVTSLWVRLFPSGQRQCSKVVLDVSGANHQQMVSLAPFVKAECQRRGAANVFMTPKGIYEPKAAGVNT